MTILSNIPLSVILKEAKQLAALTSIISDELGGAAIDSRETELIGLADDLAAGIYDHFSNSVTSGKAAAAFVAIGESGKMAAIIKAIVQANARAKAATDEDERGALINQIGWLQNSAVELADKLTCLIEEMCAEGAAA